MKSNVNSVGSVIVPKKILWLKHVNAKEDLLLFIFPVSEIGKHNRNKKKLNQIQNPTIGRNLNVESARKVFHFKSKRNIKRRFI